MVATTEAENERIGISSANVSSSELDPKRALDFLMELANSRLADWPFVNPKDEAESLARLGRNFGEFCPAEYPLAVGHAVRTAWEQPTVRGRDDVLFSALVQALGRYEAIQGQPDAERWNRIAKALWLGAKITHRMRVCANPECLRGDRVEHAGGCFVAEKKNQRYCSEKCAGEGERELKRLWWSEHGPAWREARKRAQSKKARGRKRR